MEYFVVSYMSLYPTILKDTWGIVLFTCLVIYLLKKGCTEESLILTYICENYESKFPTETSRIPEKIVVWTNSQSSCL